MAAQKRQYRVLVVGGNDRICDFITEILPKDSYAPLLRAESAGAAKRYLMHTPADIVILNAPLKDEFGTQLAMDLAQDNLGVLLLVGSDVYEQVSYQVEDLGVFTLPKPMSRQSFYASVRVLTALRGRLLQMEQKYQVLQEKMMDIRTVNRAKWLLIERHRMTERDAHYYIEKQAMDMRLSRREVAENIIRTYDL